MEEPVRTHLLTRVLAAAAVIALAVLVAAVTLSRHHRRDRPAPGAVDSTGPSATPASLPSSWEPSPARLPADVTTAWTYLDSIDGSVRHAGADTKHDLHYLIVPAAAQDYMDTLSSRGQSLSPYATAAMFAALAQNVAAADNLIELAGGAYRVTQDIIDACSLPDVATTPPAASVTTAARYAACLREGALADPESARWVLDQMRNNVGGIGDERGNDGRQHLAQYNSIVKVGDRYHTWCIGAGAYWSAAVWVDAPAERGQLFGVAACALTARHQFPPDTQPAPGSELPTPAATA
jgi:hypothetical protein